MIKLAKKILNTLSVSNALADKMFAAKSKNINYQSVKLIDMVYFEEMGVLVDPIDDILRLDENSVEFTTLEEREFPGNSENIESEYQHTMLKRYIYAGKWFCEGKKVLDSCSGLGWGTYLLSQYANQISAFDISRESIEFSQNQWKASNIEWGVGDALNLDNYADNSFDVAVAMETIEHFSKENGEKYILNLKRKIKPGGIIIGSSAFPFRRKKADKLCATNPFHLHVFTYFEFARFLKSNFRESKIIGNWIFIARK